MYIRLKSPQRAVPFPLPKCAHNRYRTKCHDHRDWNQQAHVNVPQRERDPSTEKRSQIRQQHVRCVRKEGLVRQNIGPVEGDPRKKHSRIGRTPQHHEPNSQICPCNRATRNRCVDKHCAGACGAVRPRPMRPYRHQHRRIKADRDLMDQHRQRMEQANQ